MSVDAILLNVCIVKSMMATTMIRTWLSIGDNRI
jgi:hypothetical protein